jgi:hypothetical protein
MSTKFRPSDLVPAGFIAERITHIDDETCILLSGGGATAPCPACGRISRTVRSRYCRQVADLPLSGRRVRLLVRTRRFACDAVLCGRQIFSEGFGDVLPPYARRTGRLEDLVHHLDRRMRSVGPQKTLLAPACVTISGIPCRDRRPVVAAATDDGR